MPVRTLGESVVESRGSLTVPDGAVHYSVRTMKGSSRAWIMSPDGMVIAGSSLTDALRKLGASLNYSSNDLAALL